MKIIQISSHFPPHLGGMEGRIKDLSENLLKKGHQIEIFTSDIKCPKDKQIKSTKNLKINYLKSWEFAHTPIIPSLFFKLLKTPKDSIIHLHAVQAFVPEIVYLSSKITKTPYISHIRGDPKSSGFFGFLLKPYQKIILKKVLKNSNRIIALNEDYKNLVSEKYDIPKEKIVVIPNATNFKISKKIKTKIHHPINLLFVGRLSIEKNIPKLVEAVSLLDKKVILHIVGEGEKRKEIENLIREKNLKNIILHGRKEGEDLVKMYNLADIFLLPSEYECFSSTLLEAMSTATPIIASNIPGTKNIIKNEHNGLLVKPSPEEIAKAIEKLIKNPKLREKLAKNGLKEVKKYSWDKIVDQTIEVYKQVLAEHENKQK